MGTPTLNFQHWTVFGFNAALRGARVFASDWKSAWRAHAVLQLCGAGVFLSGYLASEMTGHVLPVSPKAFAFKYIYIAAVIVLIALAAFKFLSMALFERPKHPAGELARWFWNLVADSRRLANGFHGMVFIFLLMAGFTMWKNQIARILAFGWDPALAHLDRFVHFGHAPHELLIMVIGFPIATFLININYLAWFHVLFIACFVAAFQTNRTFLRQRFLYALLLGWLLGGILLAVAALSSLIEHLLEEQPVRMSALFLGLVLGAIWVAWRLLARVDAAALALMIGVGLAMFLLLGLRADTSTATDAAAEVVTEPAWIFFLSGALAICAMILPGISGSFILVLIGMYDEVLGAVNERDFAVLGAFVLGCIIGLALFSTLLSWLLDNYHNLVIAALIGLMIGSTRVLWPWPGGTETTTLAAPEGDVLVPVLLIVLGLVVVVVVETVATQLTSAASRSMPSEMSSSPRANENRP